MIPALKVFALVIAFWVHGEDPDGGLNGYVEAHAFASMTDCQTARKTALDEMLGMGSKGVVAYSINCTESDMTLLGKFDAHDIK